MMQELPFDKNNIFNSKVSPHQKSTQGPFSTLIPDFIPIFPTRRGSFCNVQEWTETHLWKLPIGGLATAVTSLCLKTDTSEAAQETYLNYGIGWQNVSLLF